MSDWSPKNKGHKITRKIKKLTKLKILVLVLLRGGRVTNALEYTCEYQQLEQHRLRD